MRKQMGLALCAVLIVCATARAQDPRKDERAIRAVAAHWQDDWNHHNFKALASLFAVDGDYVNDEGLLLRGRAEVANWYAGDHRQMYLGSRWTTYEFTFRFLQQDIAIIHARWTVSGDLDQKGLPRKRRSGISTWLRVKLGDGWKIRTAQDTAGQ